MGRGEARDGRATLLRVDGPGSLMGASEIESTGAGRAQRLGELSVTRISGPLRAGTLESMQAVGASTGGTGTFITTRGEDQCQIPEIRRCADSREGTGLGSPRLGSPD